MTSLSWDSAQERVFIAAGSKRGAKAIIYSAFFVKDGKPHFAEVLAIPPGRKFVGTCYPEVLVLYKENDQDAEEKLQTLYSSFFNHQLSGPERQNAIASFRQLFSSFLHSKKMKYEPDYKNTSLSTFWNFAVEKLAEKGEWGLAVEAAKNFTSSRSALMTSEDCSPETVAYLINKPLTAVSYCLENNLQKSATELLEAAKDAKTAARFCQSFDRIGLVETEHHAALAESKLSKMPTNAYGK